jgi:hypothetical protein
MFLARAVTGAGGGARVRLMPDRAWTAIASSLSRSGRSSTTCQIPGGKGCWNRLPAGPGPLSEWRVIHPEHVPGSICIPRAPDASASTLPARAPCAGCGNHFNRQASELLHEDAYFLNHDQRSGNRNQESQNSHLPSTDKSTTIRLWIDWVQHLPLCPIQPDGG